MGSAGGAGGLGGLGPGGRGPFSFLPGGCRIFGSLLDCWLGPWLPPFLGLPLPLLLPPLAPFETCERCEKKTTGMEGARTPATVL